MSAFGASLLMSSAARANHIKSSINSFIRISYLILSCPYQWFHQGQDPWWHSWETRGPWEGLSDQSYFAPGHFSRLLTRQLEWSLRSPFFELGPHFAFGSFFALLPERFSESSVALHLDSRHFGRAVESPGCPSLVWRSFWRNPKGGYERIGNERGLRLLQQYRKTPIISQYLSQSKH